ncbi:MAG: HAMP domain-containing histidine kinase [Cytophagales bacterium]|jgi:signal transduction histidine kinase|nr:HAMP domain-containing histidine kinase [Cytophagales bacterium]
MKIRNKLAYLFASLVAGLLLCFSGGIYVLSAQYREAEFYERLREKAVTTARLLYEAKDRITPSMLNMIDEQSKPVLYDEQLTIYNSKGQVVYADNVKPHELLPTTLEHLSRQPGGEVRTYEGETQVLYKIYREPDERLVVIISAIDKYGISKLNFLTAILSVGWFVSVGLIIAGGWFFAGKALQPISDVIHQVEQIDSATVDTRRVKAGNDKDEVAQLAATFNQMLDRLQKSFQIQRSFVANASHELRTPLTVMNGQIEVALMKTRTPDEYRRLLALLTDEIKNMTALANALLDMAQADSDATALRMRKVRVDELVLQAEADLLARKTGCQVAIDLARPVATETDYELPADERLLKNAFLNLMENACKFSADKRVEVLLDTTNREIHVSFSDKGVGIAEQDLPYIFEPFYRADGTRTVAGHGLGLPLAKRIVEMHHGRIAVDSEPGKGTTFTVTLQK